MKCTKCNHTLPADSEFCQYCGARIEKTVAPLKEAKPEPIVEEVPTAPTEEIVVEPPATEVPEQMQPIEETADVVPIIEKPESSAHQLPDFGNMTPDEALTAILQIQAKNTVDAMEANCQSQPDNEADADFGLVPEKPIFTLALKSVEGEKEYLGRLYTLNGEKIKYNRRGSTSADGINGMIDIYDTYLPSGQPYKTIYINMYGAKRSNKAPAGFLLGRPAARPAIVPTQPKQQPATIPMPVSAPAQQNKKTAPVKYCSRCGSAIDSKTKKCTGCGKQYFRGLRFTKFSVTIIILSLVIAVLSTVCVLQFLNVQALGSAHQTEIDKLKSKISSLEQQIKTKDSTIKTRDTTIKNLEKEIDKLEEEAWDNWSKLYFFDNYAEIVPDDGTRTYHKWGCSKLDTSDGFWIFNTAAAEDDYKKCPTCH